MDYLKKHLKFIITLSIGLTTIATSHSQTCSEVIKTEKFTGYIMADSVSCFCSSKNAKRFTPNKKTIVELDQLLTEQISILNHEHQSQYHKRNFIENRLNEYHRQYFGFYHKKTNHKMIYINCFLSDSFNKPECQEVIVLDGGSSYWQVIYDLELKTFIKFNVNGDA